MERFSRLIEKSKVSRQVLTDEDRARAAWPAAVGKTIVAHTSRIRLVRSTLVVEVEDAIWQQQLYRLSEQILNRVHKVTGSDSIKDIEFRIRTPRIQPQREHKHESAMPRSKGAFAK
jgi:predicted nucleic acid-binding Zn ribbon protein